MDKVTDSKHNGSSHGDYPSIYRKIRRSFGLMTLVMFGLFWTVIYIAENQMEVISLHHWLDTEANRYTSEYQLLGEDALLPNQNEFSSYWSEAELPNWLARYKQPGFYEHLLGTEDKHFYVFEHPSGEGLMYILFQDDADDYLDEYEWSLHNYTLILGGLTSIFMVLYGIYVVRSLSKPLNQIEKKIRQMHPEQPSFEVETSYAETRHIEQTLLDSKNHISGFFQREEEFNRFASHELRTPIMVIKGSADLLTKVPNQPPVALKAINRLQEASEQMRVLTEMFLLLGKESIDEHHFGHYDLEVEVQNQLLEMAPLFAKQDASYNLDVKGTVTVYAPESFITIVLNNLIKNAFSYSVGDVGIVVTGSQLVITNRHDGNETYNAGYGCGLVIVQRICERMGWSFETQDDGLQFSTYLDFSVNNQVGSR
ncbi:MULTISPECIES: sensor histidine kinase [Vibrio]|uniref:sensor histidine kinase n=1 Tax=Vibrio TaxID=662 RepID=UPI000D3CF6AE|nr:MULTISPECIES: HAMP domain-containing sensor histidine kinase [unclassified Vibrio]PTO96563.1 sensor histidine kinase [Vibrio sp. 10N.286.48.B8]TKE88095.1 HAMP domain-containing histidine kinase [Vibrio sp. F12]